LEIHNERTRSNEYKLKVGEFCPGIGKKVFHSAGCQTPEKVLREAG